VAKKKPVEPELRSAARKMHDIMEMGQDTIDELVMERGWDPLNYELTDVETYLLREHLYELSQDPLSHRRPKNKFRDRRIVSVVKQMEQI